MKFVNVPPHPGVQGPAAQITPPLSAAEAEILILCLTDTAKRVLFFAGSAACAVASGENKDRKGKEGCDGCSCVLNCYSSFCCICSHECADMIFCSSADSLSQDNPLE